MVYCSQCGTESPPDAAFCRKCGARLHPWSSRFEWHMDQFSRDMEHLGDRIDQRVRYHRWYAGSRYDHAFGIFGPLVGSVIGFVILVVFIAILEAAAPSTPYASQIAVFFKDNLLVFFGLMLVSGYTTYAARRYRPFRWVSPLIGAVIFFIVFTLVTQFLIDLSTVPGTHDLTGVIDLLKFLAIPLTLLILVLGYLGVIGSLLWHEPPRPPYRPRDEQPHSPPPAQQRRDVQPPPPSPPSPPPQG